ncbi:TonB-dependent receptor domain-containing protein [Luteimonas sp. WGS1318]|uniref:TonB-dependent receptor domain-containing protein n=1 Tax=Luteimonas sp. WGS1318 TaxID=3366815 RepID=UPI00372D4BF1
MKNLRTPALRKGLLPLAVLTALVPAAVSAQEQATATGATNLDRIQVTGSRIRQASLETAQPVILMQRADIERQGFVSVADIIQNISTSGSPAISRADALASGENVGGQYVDLRNLGPQRTLVLLDGRRMGITSDGYSDLAAIPTSVVERVEILTDGASAIYGSDAIAGVINIITRRNFDGFEASAYYGQFGQGDGSKESYNFLAGTTGERSSFTLGAEFSKENPVRAADRSFSAFPNGPYHPVPDIDPATGDPRTNGWSAATNKGILFVGDDAFTLAPGGDPRNFADYRPTDPLTDYTNPSQEMFLQTGLERRSVFANGTFDFNENVRLRGDFLYTHRETLQQIAGYPFQNYAFDDVVLSAGSYFNPTGEDSDFIRRTSEVPRRTTRELTTYRFSGGLEGSFDIGERFWDWDVGYVYNQNKGTVTGRGDLFLPNVRAALGPSFMDTDGVVKCGAAGAVISGCTPWNPLAPVGGGYSNTLADPALQSFLLLPTHDTSETTTQIFSANLGGVIATLPAGDLGMAVGVEHRKEEAVYEPDALLQSGQTTSLAGGPTQGGYSLNEAFVEFQIPLLADVALAQELSLDLAGRYSDYDTFGNTTNGKAGLKWKPIEDVLVRGTFATGFRAPTVGDLFGGTSQTFDFYTDPCDTLFGAAVRNPSVAAVCGADGLPANFRQIASGNVQATGPGSQSAVPYLSGSNPELLPEESRTWTLGVVYSPSFLDGFDVSLDWWKIRINDVIAAESVTSILNQCYVLGIDSACDRFVRSGAGQVVDVTRTLINGGYQETAGYDLGIRYRLPETAVGNFVVDWKTTYVDYLEYKRDNEAETPIEQFAGWGGNFRVRSNLSLDWSPNDDFGVNWGVRYYSSMKEACTYDLDGGPECNLPDFSSSYTLEQPSHKQGSNTFHDVQVRYNTPWNATVSVGANNVFNHEGPIMYSQPNSNFPYYGGFDIGRFMYMKYQQRF